MAEVVDPPFRFACEFGFHSSMTALACLRRKTYMVNRNYQIRGCASERERERDIYFDPESPNEGGGWLTHIMNRYRQMRGRV